MARRCRDKIALVASLVLLLAAGLVVQSADAPGGPSGDWVENRVTAAITVSNCLLLHRTSRAGLAGVAATLMPAWEDPWATTTDVGHAPRAVVHFDNKPAGFTTRHHRALASA